MGLVYKGRTWLPRQRLRLLILTLILFMVFWIHQSTLPTGTSPQTSLDEAIEEWDQQALERFGPRGLHLGPGRKRRQMTSVVFVDFACSKSRQNYIRNRQQIGSMPHLQVTFKMFPLDRSCNPYADERKDGLSCELALLAICADLRGVRHSKILETLFADPPTTAPDLYVQSLADQLGIRPAQFLQCKMNPKLHLVLTEMVQEGRRHQRLPAVYVQDRFFLAGERPTATVRLYRELAKIRGENSEP